MTPFLLTVSLALASVLPDNTQPLDVKQLTEIAARHRLPMPPKNARLILAHTESWQVLGNRSTSRDPGIYSPAFLLEERIDGSVVVLRGAERQTMKRRHGTESLCRPFLLDQPPPKLGGYLASFGRLSAFMCAIQLAARGDEAEAQRVWKLFAGSGHWVDGEFGEDISAQLVNQRSLLARCIFDHLRGRLLVDEVDYREIHARMSALLREFPEIKNDARTQLFSDLGTTAKAKSPRPDSVEALLLDWARQTSDRGTIRLFREEGDADAPARAILTRGFEAIPELLDLLEDRRLTAHEIPAFMKAPAQIVRVGDLAERLLEKMGYAPVSSRIPNAILARNWWENIRGQNEQEYFAAQAFDRKGKLITSVNDTPVGILAHKWPDRLPGLCEEFAKHATSDAHPSLLPRALATSRLPKEVRVKVLTSLAGRGSLLQQCSFLVTLAAMDEKECARMLKDVFKAIPADVPGRYWTCPESYFTGVVMRLDDDDIWRAYLSVARRSSVGLRLEMMNSMNYSHIGTRNRSRRLAFLASFLNDDAVRDMSANPEKFDGPCAGFTIKRLEVRNFVAMKIASILDLEDAPDEFWTANEWAGLREKLRKKLEAENLPDIGQNK